MPVLKTAGDWINYLNRLPNKEVTVEIDMNPHDGGSFEFFEVPEHAGTIDDVLLVRPTRFMEER